MARSKTTPSTRRLSEVARHVVVPTGIVTTGWPAVEAKCAEWGDEFDEWQRGAGRVILGKRADGLYAATVGGITLSIPRQVAKTFLVGRIIFALCALFPGMRILWTAHHMATLSNTFRSLAGFARRKKVAPYIAHIRRGSGKESIEFANGSVIFFGARSQGFGRGFDEVDVEVFDEAQILDEKALEDMVAATNQSRHEHGALLFYMGTPPRPVDPGEAFISRRKAALTDKPSDVVVIERGDAVYIETSADENVGQPGGPALDNPDQIKKANPSYPHRTPPVSVARLRANLNSDDAWRREGLGVWDEDTSATVIKSKQWASLAIARELAPRDGPVAYGVKFSLDGARVGCGVARLAPSGVVHVEALGVHPMDEGTASLVAWLAARARKGWIVIDGKAGAGDLLNELVAAGVSRRRVHLVTTDEAITAHAGFLRAVQEKSLTGVSQLSHIGQPGLDAQVRIAGKRKIGNAGGWGWQPVTADGDVTALDSVTIARHAVVTRKHPTGEGRTAGNRTSSGRMGVVA